MTKLRVFMIALVLVGATVTRVTAIDRVTVSIASAGDVGAAIVPASSSDSLSIIVVDPRGTASGWEISISSNFEIINIGSLRVLEGQPIVDAGPYTESLRGGYLIAARKTVWAKRGAGSGNYAQRIIVVPVDSGSRTLVTVTVGLAP